MTSDKSDEDILRAEVHAAWDPWPAPPPSDLQILAREWGGPVWRAFAGIPPMKVDIDSAEFLGCTPLLNLPPQAAAAYLGTYLLSFLDGAAFQHSVGVFHDPVTRAHVISCLKGERFWRTCLIPWMSPPARTTLLHFVDYLDRYRDDFSLPPEDVSRMRRLESASGFRAD